MKNRVKKNVGKARRRLKKMGRRRSGLGQLSDQLRSTGTIYEDVHTRLFGEVYYLCNSVLENIALYSRNIFRWWANATDRPLANFPTREQFLANPSEVILAARSAMLDQGWDQQAIDTKIQRTMAMISGDHTGDIQGTAEHCVKPTSLKALSGLGQIVRASNIYRRRGTTPETEYPLAVESFELRLALAEKDVEAAEADNNKCMRAFNSAADVAWETARILAVATNPPLNDQALTDRVTALDRKFKDACLR